MLRTALLASLLALALPVAAQASTASISWDGHLTVIAAEGEVNKVKITREDIALPVAVWDTAGVTGCMQAVSPTHVRCGGGSPVVVLGDRDDELHYSDDTTDEFSLIGPADVQGGTGDDTITTAYSNDVIDAGPGKDVVEGYVGDDTIDGGEGDDQLKGFYGRDTIKAGPGDDTVLAGEDDDVIDARDGAGGDKVNCGGGTDVLKADAGDQSVECETVDLPVVVTEQPKPQPQEPGPVAPNDPAPPQQQGPITPRADDPAAADRRAPGLKATLRRGVLRVTADEDATVKLGRRTVKLAAGKAKRLRVGRRAKRLTLVATDAAGNRAQLVVKARKVKRKR